MHTCSFAELCPTLCNPMDSSPLGSSVHGIFPGKNTRVSCHFLLQGIFPAQKLNPCLLHLQVDSLPLSHLGSPRVNAIPVKFQQVGVVYIETFKLSLKFIWKCKWPILAKITLTKKNNARVFTLIDSKVYCKATVIKRVWYWHGVKHIGQ